METQFTLEERKRIEEGIQGKYAKVATSPEGLFRYPTGRAGLVALNYGDGVIKALPESIASAFCGVGNPFSLGPIHVGEKVLDVGCGAGVDTIIAGMMVGSTGKVIGIDMTSEMLVRANRNLRMTGQNHVSFQQASAEVLPFPDHSFDVIISNGVFNLVPDKRKALSEVFRVLKPQGRLMMADQVFIGTQQKDSKARVDSWSQWEGGAIPGRDFLALLKLVGFTDVELVAETGFNSSPVTKGTLFRAIRPVSHVMEDHDMEDSLSKYQEFFDQTYAEGALDRKTKHLIALGASLAAGCEAWTKYSLAVARELGATKEELREAMAIAMTVGATKIQILQENALASVPQKKSSETKTEDKGNPTGEQEICSVWPTKSSSGWAERQKKTFRGYSNPGVFFLEPGLNSSFILFR